MSGSELPQGTVTFLFSDIEGSTRLLSRLGADYATVLADQRRIVQAAIADCHGYEVDTQGDAFFVAFARAQEALDAAVGIQRALATYRGPDGTVLRVRMGLHSGEPVIGTAGYVGMDVHRAARICAAGHGGQVLLSETTLALVIDSLPPDVGYRDLGKHILKDLSRPQHLYQVLIGGLPAEFPPLKSLGYLPNNLPLQLTSYVGREREMAEIQRLLDETRLLTLTGPGGSGKTRLALHAAAELLGRYPAGAWFVDLAPVADPALVARVAAAVFGLRDEAWRSPAQALIDYLRPRRLLLMIDNCEHVVEASATLADALLHECPELRVLATSREALDVEGEIAWPIPPLPVLPRPTEGNAAVDVIAGSDSARLFAERARQVVPTFSLTPANATAVAQICRRLDGMPLAIELAAARVKVLSPEQIAARLDDRFHLLTAGRRSAPPRQQSLTALIDWSYNLLPETERLLFARLSVFSGGWTFEAAEVVCRGDGIEDYEVLDLLGRLVDKSLVVTNAGAQDAEGQTRFRFLETIRQYALERLGGAEAEFRRRHLASYVALAESAERSLYGPAHLEWLKRLDAEADNLRSAIAWSLGHSPVEALRLTGALWLWAFQRGYYIEAYDWTRAALAAAPEAGLELRVRGLRAAGSYAGLRLQRYKEAISLLEEGLRLARQIGDFYSEGVCLHHLASVAIHQNDPEQARVLAEEGLAVARNGQEPWVEGLNLNILANLAAADGDTKTARALHETRLSLDHKHGDSWPATYTLRDLGLIAEREGDYHRAEELFAESLAIAREYGDRAVASDDLRLLGRLALAEGRLRDAPGFLTDCLRIERDLAMFEGAADTIDLLAVIAYRSDDTERAARLLGAGVSLRAAGYASASAVERDAMSSQVAELSNALGARRYESLRAWGRDLTRDQAIAFALGEGPEGAPGVVTWEPDPPVTPV